MATAWALSGSSDQRPDCQTHPTNVSETIHSASLNCPIDLCIVFETEILHHLFNFTSYSTSCNCLIDPRIVFETETLDLFNFTRPVDPRIVFETSIRRIAMFHGGEQWAWIDD